MTGYKHHRNSFDFFDDLIHGPLTVSTTAVSAKVNAQELDRRKSVMIINDSSNLIYTSLTQTFDISAGEGFLILSGEAFVYQLNPNDNRKIWVKTDELTANIVICEVR